MNLTYDNMPRAHTHPTTAIDSRRSNEEIIDDVFIVLDMEKIKSVASLVNLCAYGFLNTEANGTVTVLAQLLSNHIKLYT